MTDRLTEIEARAKAATPGPWHATDNWYDGPLHGVASADGHEFVGISHGERPTTEVNEAQEKADATFIAAAPDDIAWLVAEVKRLRDELCRVAPFLALHGVSGYTMERSQQPLVGSYGDQP